MGNAFVYYALVGLLALSLLPGRVVAAEAQSDWFNASPEVHDEHEFHSTVPYSIYGNRNCTWQDIVTVPEKILPYPPYIQSEVSHESCVVDTGYGAVSQSGYLQVAGETVFGRVTYPNGASLTLLPVPRSPHGVYMAPNYPNGMKLFKINNMIEQLVGTTYANGERVYRLKSDFTSTPLRDYSGNIVGVQTDSISFSNSGSWMVADIPFVGLARINMSSFQIQVFDTGFNYFVGSAPGVQSAVSMSGRYVAVGSRSHTRFALYDLENCQSSSICKKLDLWQYFRSREPSYEGPGRIRFTSEFSMKFYNVSKPNGKRKIDTLKLAANGHPPVDFEYLALGDSFASGEGAYQYKAVTDTGVNKCHVSQRAYPYLIAEALSISEMESIACAGAVIEDINSADEDYDGQINDRVMLRDRTNKEEILEEFLPGYLPQNYFLDNYNPEAITLSVLGNDIGFSKIIMRCLEPDTCYASYEDRLELVYRINNKFDDLLRLYADIGEQMEGKRVYVLGYPSIVAEGGSCSLNVPLNSEELTFANKLVKHLNGVMKAAADRHGYYYVDLEYAMKGQRLCEASSFAVAFNGLTAGNDIVDIPFTDFGGPVGNESFHPNHIGHNLLKQAVIEKTSNLTAPMPSPNTNAQPPKDMSQIELLQGAPKANREVLQVNYDDKMGNEVAFRGGVWNGYLTGLKALHPLVRTYIHSEPTLLGTFTSAKDGSLAFSVQIPDDTPTGFHTIRVVGESLAGNPIATEKIIYVADSESDADGDGVANEQEKCLFGETSSIDTDQDGNDDACDGFIDEAPSVVEPPVIELPSIGNRRPSEDDEQHEQESDTAASGSETDSNASGLYENTKPPENNPETVAGHEQTNSEQKIPEIVGNTDNQAVQQAATANPYFVPGTAITEGQVAATQTIAATPVKQTDNSDESQRAPVNTIYLWLLPGLPIMLVLVVGVIYPFRKDS